MAPSSDVSMEDEDELSLLASFGMRTGPAKQPTPQMKPPSTLMEIHPPSLPNLEDYEELEVEERVVDTVLEELEGDEIFYRVRFTDGSHDVVFFDDLIELDGGREALDLFERIPEQDESDDTASTADQDTRPSGRRSGNGYATRRSGRAEPIEILESSDELDSSSEAPRRTRRRDTTRYEPSSESDAPPRRGVARRGRARQVAQPLRRSTRQTADEIRYNQAIDSSEDDGDSDLLESDVRPKVKRPRYSDNMRREGLRTSTRTTKTSRNMAEASMSDVFRSDLEPPKAAPRPTAAKEIFPFMDRTNPFAQRHLQQCDTCERPGGPAGPLIYCQGCSLSYHKQCIGNRGNRDHLVTKVNDDQYVLQCRRCVNLTRRKDPLAPDHAICQTCRDVGPACIPFRARKTAMQEAKDREENDGLDPITDVDSMLINNIDNVLFRCVTCARAFHYHHLPSKVDIMDIIGDDDELVADQRWREYGSNWECKECSEKPAKVGGLIAWRPTDPEDYNPNIDTTEVAEDEKEYLIKWDKRSYFQAQWMPGAWTWGVTAHVTRKAFSKRDNERNTAKMTTEEAIPEDYLRIDIVLEVKFTSFVETRAEEIDKARIREVDTALMKYKGLGYEDAVWEKPPGPEDGDRWVDFVRAYDDWVIGRYVKVPKSGPLKARVDKARSQDFNELEKKEQPKSLSGGKLMNYQLEGLNWLYFRWHQAKNGILADEMGLGKTIQIIGLLATLVEDHNCFPFLLVVPNSTCPNWRREIKQWAPSLRVVTYYGMAQARRLAYEHELFPEGSKSLKCHVVVTSYDTAADEGCRKLFKSTPWQGLIVDEGQRLKSDKTNLYGILKDLKIPFSVLLTGTPLQNNARELFNLLQFLDPSFDAESMELEYAELTKDNIPQLHDLIRPFFLRRTKAQVLKFLPPLAQVILPVSMSVVQRKLYKSILSKNPDLLKAIFNSDKVVGKGEKATLNNILMQLRKCLAHPFVYSADIEERDVSTQVSHRNLVDASGKLQLLDLLLPALKEKGHRVLIFSQFLDMLSMTEDFLDGLGYHYQRLDGNVSSLQKQTRIDKFNAPGSEDFAFLLSTRAGGVGINLASADTVIILDPDFNPHQDIQALSRAHRIGQTKKVLCFQLMTHGSVEEKIMQIGRKKMALDHVLIERMDDSEETVVDVESILKHGAAAILEGIEESSIRYDQASIEKLLDRSGMETTQADADMTAESQFSFARVWANDTGALKEGLDENGREERAPDVGVWDKILQERERLAAEEAMHRQQAFGRGRRSKQVRVDYRPKWPDLTSDDEKAVDYDVDHIRGESPGPQAADQQGSDTDFHEGKSDDDDDDDDDEAQGEASNRMDIDQDLADIQQLNERRGLKVTGRERTIAAPAPAHGPPRMPTASTSRAEPAKDTAPTRERVHKQWRRSNVMWPNRPEDVPAYATDQQKAAPPPVTNACLACGSSHRIGYCPLKLADVEYCNLCGLAHYGKARTCPHIRSETQVRAMLQALKHSNEPPELVAEASRYLSGVKGNLAQHKRKMAAAAQGIPYAAMMGYTDMPAPGGGPGLPYAASVAVMGGPQTVPGPHAGMAGYPVGPLPSSTHFGGFMHGAQQGLSMGRGAAPYVPVAGSSGHRLGQSTPVVPSNGQPGPSAGGHSAQTGRP